MASVELPRDVHRVTARGKVYYYWHPGRGTKRAAERVRLPDPEQDPRGFWAKVEALGGRPEFRAKSVGAMLTAWRNSPEFDGLAAPTQRDYERYIGLWREKIGEFMARDIRPVHVIAVRDEMADKPSTANHAVAVLSAGYVWGAPRDYSSINPCKLVPKLKVETDGRLPWPAWALEIAATQFRPELRRAVALGLYTGQRLGDVLTMRLVDIEGEGINVRQSKTGKRLFIPFHAALKAEIAEAVKDGRIYLVSRADGRPFTSQDFQAMWTREMEKEPHGRIRREGFSFHGLRSLAVAALAEMVDAIRISAITGQSLNVVERYLKDHRQRELAVQAIKAWEHRAQQELPHAPRKQRKPNGPANPSQDLAGDTEPRGRHL